MIFELVLSIWNLATLIIEVFESHLRPGAFGTFTPIMKYLRFAIFILLIQSKYGIAQQPVVGLSVQVSFGASIPVGTFGSKSPNELYSDNQPKASGLAEAGPLIQLNINYQIKQSFGISFLISGQQNKQNSAAFQSDISQTLNSSDQFVVTTNSWQILKILAGGFYDLTITKEKLYFRPKVLIGILKTSLPAYSFYDRTSFSYSGNQKDNPLPWAFSYDLGGDLQWWFSKKMFIAVGLDYSHAGPKGYNFSVLNITTHQNTKIPISLINATVGIGYGF